MPPPELPTTVPSATQLSLSRDVIVVVAITLACALLAAHFELNEAVYSLTRRWEHLQLDEWPIALFALSVCLVWLSWRRYRQTLVQLGARQAAEERLSAALADNRQLAHQHLRIQESERRHLARELHDELGQYLNAIKLDAVAIDATTAGDATASVRAAQRIVQAVDHVHAVVSNMIRRLRPAGLDELGLLAALENCVDQWRQRLPGTRFSLSASGSFDDLGELVNLTLYRLVQEGLTNSYKHAAAQQIDIVLQRDAARSGSQDELVLTVCDDGRGMDLATRKPGFGLGGIRERVHMMGGHFAMDTAPGKGFSFEVRLPAVGHE